MTITSKNKNLRIKIIIFESVFLIILFTIFFKIYDYSNKLYIASENRVNMLLAADKLRHSSDDLTNFARSYVVTKNPKFKKEYFDVLAIRNGEAKRPYNYQFLYWDLTKQERAKKHPPMKKESLDSILKKLPFTSEEIKLLQTAKDNSDKLAILENIAFAELKNNNQKQAIKLLFSDAYFKAKSDIMNPIDDFIIKVNKRTKKYIQNLKNKIDKMLKLFVLLGILFIVVNVYIYFYLKNNSKQQLKEKNELIEEINHLNEYLEHKVELRTKRIEELLKVKSEFLANMSHEIRTPLNAMFGFIRILRDKKFDKETNQYLSIIEKSGKNLLAIINDILDFSKIEAGKLNIEKIEFNPKEEIEIIYNLFVSQAREKKLILEINDNFKYNIVTDPTRLKQVISNLLSNAIKFTDENKKVILNLNYNDKTEYLYVEVIDEGIGIEKNKLKYIFDAFSQADNSTTRKYGGTGLGLSISYKLIKLLGGELKVESEIGKGSKFFFKIPAKKSTEITTKKIENNKIVDKKYDFHILLVEDNIANQMFMKVILKKFGISFDVANNGLEAIELFKKHKYDFILMDENMPKMNGIEATKKIRKYERENSLQHTIIIALTANAMDGDKEKFISIGMDYYLSKPLDIEKFKKILVDLDN